MDVMFLDYNNAGSYFGRDASAEWSELHQMLLAAPLFLQPSGQQGKTGQAIFDPKATNAHLTRESSVLGWNSIRVPDDLSEFGVDWDGGKNETLAEWQFSNYPFLWNNIIRSEAMFKSGRPLPGMPRVQALIVVTKRGSLPSSNSTLYFEQARAQLNAVMGYGTFAIPIRLVGLGVPAGVTTQEAYWSQYGARYGRAHDTQELVTARVRWSGRMNRYGYEGAAFDIPS